MIEQSRKNTLHALGGAHDNAMRGLATGNRNGKAAKREQEVFTPDVILDFVRLAFGGEIILDPCASPRRESFSRYSCYGLDGDNDNGLKFGWPGRTFANPPFRDLKKWLAKACSEASWIHDRIIVLCPVRTHRVWYRAARDQAKRSGFVLELNPFAFAGYTQAFPVPCALLAYHCDLTEEVRAAGLKLGGFA